MRIGIAITGSFCNIDMAFDAIEEFVAAGADVTSIISYNVNELDTRFHRAIDIKNKLRYLTGKNVIKTITAAEPVGPSDMFDVILVAPATGNTIAKLASSITDTPVLMAVKSHLRNKKPVVIGISTNDGLGNNGANIGKLMNMENVYFVPFSQDDPVKKEMSIVCHADRFVDSLLCAVSGRQVQPVIVG